VTIYGLVCLLQVLAVAALFYMWFKNAVIENENTKGDR